MIIDHNDLRYRARWSDSNENRFNGAFFYSKEIVKNIIPRVKTDRNWITINTLGIAYDHSIIFIHNNLHPERYEWISKYKDVVLVCGVPETCEKVKHLGKAIYLPLSVDVKYVKKFMSDKIFDCAFAGRLAKRAGLKLPIDCDIIGGLPRNELLSAMAMYEKIYAVGRTAIEARILGCEIGVYDPRFPDPDFWGIVDNKEAAEILQCKLNEIDKEKL